MMPKVIIHNEISLDGAVTGFDPDMGIYYQTALGYKPDILLVGSDTILAATDKILPEQKSDFSKPDISNDDKRPLWVIPDSRGRLINTLHFYRRMEFIKDIVVLVTKTTPRSYVDYLNKRQYNMILSGTDHVDYKKAFEILYDMYHTRTIVTDSGGILNNILIKQALVDEISILVSPTLTGTKHPHLFRSLEIDDKLKLKLLKCKSVEDNLVLLLYKILK